MQLEIYLVSMDFILYFIIIEKTIPTNIIELLTPISSSYWIMVDVSWTGYGLHTNNYTKDEVNLLIITLNTKFNLNSSINIANLSKSQYTIYIPNKDIPHVKSLVLPYLLPSFLYKLGIE